MIIPVPIVRPPSRMLERRDSSAGPKMAAGSADQTWRLAVPGSAGQCQKTKQSQKKKSFSQKTILFPKKTMDFKKTAVFKGF